jgi:serine/threonine protein kinase
MQFSHGQLDRGSVIGGYRIDEMIGRGGMGIVYRATNVALNRIYALKVLAPELSDDDQFQERFKREVRIAASLHHPHVIGIHYAGEHDGVLFLVMDFVYGSDLGNLLRERGALEPDRAVEIVSQIASALDAAHAKGLVHRDVKPANVLITVRDGQEHAYLTDFGLAKRSDTVGGLTRKGVVVGTVDYMSPEQITGGATDARSDIYALGCTFFHMLTGNVPYERENSVATLFAHVHEPPPPLEAPLADSYPALGAVIEKAMAKEPGERYLSAGDFASDAAATLRGMRSTKPPTLVATGEARPIDRPGPETWLTPEPAAAPTKPSPGVPESEPPPIVASDDRIDPEPVSSPPAAVTAASPPPVIPASAEASQAEEPPASTPPPSATPASTPPPSATPASTPPPSATPASPPPVIPASAAATQAEEPPAGPVTSAGSRPPSGTVKRRRWLALGGLALLVACVAAAVVLLSGGSSSSTAGQHFEGAISAVPTNRVNGDGAATVAVRGNVATVTVVTNGLADAPHLMHIHGGTGKCPPASAAQVFQGHQFISAAVGDRYYGPVVSSLTQSGSTSPEYHLVASLFPATGNIRYTRTFTLGPGVATEIRNGLAVIVVHGINYDGKDTYDNFLGPGAEAGAPALCGLLVPAQSAATQAGAHGETIYTASLNGFGASTTGLARLLLLCHLVAASASPPPTPADPRSGAGPIGA